MKTSKQTIESNMAHNNILDRVFQGISVGIVLVLAYKELLIHIKAPEPISYVLAGGVIGVLVYMLLSPMFRK